MSSSFFKIFISFFQHFSGNKLSLKYNICSLQYTSRISSRGKGRDFEEAKT